MLIGAHVRAGKGLTSALEHGDEIGAEVVQIFTQSPRMWKPSQYGPEVMEGYRAAQSVHPKVKKTFCHATYLINLASPDPELALKSQLCLNANLATATGIGSEGLVLHVGSHRGAGFETTLPAVAEALLGALDSDDVAAAADLSESSAPCPILLENAAGAGDTVGRSFEELAAIIDAAEDDERLGVCLDTQHLWASGIGFASVEDADSVMKVVGDTVGIERLQCLHLNDSKVPFGANRDRHENLGAGTIGLSGLAALLGHPELQGLPAILEVPGIGDGPRAEDVAKARQVLKRGLKLRAGPTGKAGKAQNAQKAGRKTVSGKAKRETGTIGSPPGAGERPTTSRRATKGTERNRP
jgi:deoxyribonuclease-4